LEAQIQNPVLEVTDPSECEKKPRKTAKKKCHHGSNPTSSSRARPGRKVEKAPVEDRLETAAPAECSKGQSGI